MAVIRYQCDNKPKQQESFGKGIANGYLLLLENFALGEGEIMLKKSRLVLIVLLTVALSLIISACGGSDSTGPTSTNTPSTQSSTLGTPSTYTCVKSTITASGSTALAPLVQDVAKKYQAKCAGSSITVNLGGSKTGLANVEAGTSDIGNSDVYADKKTLADLVDHQVAVVPFALIINANAGVKGLTTAQIKDIYSGKATNWKDVGGPDKKIIVVSRPASSGTRATFEQYILGGPETISGPTNLTNDSTGVVIQNVAQNDGAIGYAATFPAHKNTGVVVITIDNYAPTADLVKNNTYKFWSIEHMYTKGKPKDLAQALIDYMSSSDGKASATSNGFVATSDMDPAAITAHQPKS
ncbi:MAG: phosphate ABC transporter substrate-binding protein [Chloroflexi bacterium]|nr:MAG: phosphate ABC transporter substrate-binding protein [Chloroflexota bacterium]